MTDDFDPYYQWLAIPPAEQPPNHYRLLGLNLDENNPAVIETAADRQMMHLRAMQVGKQSAASQKLLGEVAAAKRVLLSPEKKAAYDASLQPRGSQADPIDVAAPVPDFNVASIPVPARTVAGRARQARRGDDRGVLLLGGGIGAAVLVVLLAALWFSSGGDDEDQTSSPSEAATSSSANQADARQADSPSRHPQATAASAIFDRDCVCYFTFERDTFESQRGRTVVMDQSGRGNHGLPEHVRRVAGKVGDAAAFDGSSSYIEVPHLRGYLLGPPTFSIVGWCRPSAGDTRTWIFGVGLHANTSLDVIVLGDALMLYTPHEHGGDRITAPFSGKQSSRGWIHFAGVTDGRSMKVYLNGKLAAEGAIGVPAFDEKTLGPQPAHIGIQAKLDRREGRYYRGQLDELAIFKRVLSAEEIQTLYEAGSG